MHQGIYCHKAWDLAVAVDLINIKEFPSAVFHHHKPVLCKHLFHFLCQIKLLQILHISQICLYGIGFHSRRNRFPFLPLSGDQRRPLANLKIGLPRCCFPILLPVCLRRGFLSRCFHRGSRGLIPSAFPTARKQGRRQADCQ